MWVWSLFCLFTPETTASLRLTSTLSHKTISGLPTMDVAKTASSQASANTGTKSSKWSKKVETWTWHLDHSMSAEEEDRVIRSSASLTRCWDCCITYFMLCCGYIDRVVGSLCMAFNSVLIVIQITVCVETAALWAWALITVMILLY